MLFRSMGTDSPILLTRHNPMQVSHGVVLSQQCWQVVGRLAGSSCMVQLKRTPQRLRGMHAQEPPAGPDSRSRKRLHVQHKAVANIAAQHAIVGLVDARSRQNLNFGYDAVFCTKFEHFLRLPYATNQ